MIMHCVVREGEKRILATTKDDAWPPSTGWQKKKKKICRSSLADNKQRFREREGEREREREREREIERE
jgi:hypothetical protein